MTTAASQCLQVLSKGLATLCAEAVVILGPCFAGRGGLGTRLCPVAAVEAHLPAWKAYCKAAAGAITQAQSL